MWSSNLTVLVICGCIELLLYASIGVMVFHRRNRREISTRSPWLLLISHIGNTSEALLLIVQATDTMYTSGLSYLESFTFFSHYVFYVPYLLRAYRLYFVFNTDIGKGMKGDAYFLKHIERSKQTWLLKVLVAILLPILALCLLLCTVHILEEDKPSNSTRSPHFLIPYIAVSFVEQMLFMWAIYSLRNVDRAYSMNREILVVCIVWYLNLALSMRDQYRVWMYLLLCRSVIIMCVSMVVPLVGSFRRPAMKQQLTLESMYSLQIVLQHELSFEYFEQFLLSYALANPAPPDEELEFAGPKVLELYTECMVFKEDHFDPLFISKLKEFADRYRIFSEGLRTQISRFEENVVVDSDLLLEIERALFNLLRNYYFPKFQRSDYFGELCRFVEQSELRAQVMNHTSFISGELK